MQTTSPAPKVPEYEIRDQDSNWHPLQSAFFWSPSQGQRVLMWSREGSDQGYEHAALQALIQQETVRETRPRNTSASEYMSPDAARRMINEAGRRSVLEIDFDKADGSARLMICRYTGATNSGRWHMTVWDQQKNDFRQVDTRTCRSIRVLSHQKAA